MEKAFTNLIRKHKPLHVEYEKGSIEIWFILPSGVKKVLKLKEVDQFKIVKSSIEGMIEYEERKDFGHKIIFKFDWNRKVNSKLLKDSGTDNIVKIDVKKKRKVLDINEAYKIVHNIMTDGSLLECVVTSNGVLIEDGKVNSDGIDSSVASTLFDNMSEDEETSVGSASKEIEVGDIGYILVRKKIGDEKSVKVVRKITSFNKLIMGMATEMRERLQVLKSGIIVSTIHPYAKMEPIVALMRKYDENFDKIACEVGNCLIETKLPRQVTGTHIDRLAESHYKYVLIDMTKITVENIIEEIMNLVYSGKVVILGYNGDSSYSAMMSLLDNCGGNNFGTSKVLASTVGFLHPVLSYYNGDFSLEDSESVTLSTTKIEGIMNGELSKERFNSFIEYPSKIYKVDGKSILGLTEFRGKPITTPEEEIHALLEESKRVGASDIHLVVNAYPMFRIKGDLVPINNEHKLSVDALKQIVNTLTLTELQNDILKRDQELEMAYSVSGLGRFRVQIVTQRGTYGVVIRTTSHNIPNLEQIQLPKVVSDAILYNPKGLVLVTGPTSSGKSTTCAALIEALKNKDSYAITTISDPIEFLHSHGKGIVTQREIPTDVDSYDRALSSSLRMDPDIIEVSEVRSSKALSTLLRFGNSGHLAISTMHTSSVKSTFDAIVNMMPPERKDEILSTLSQTLVCIINQQLVKGVDGNLVPIFEYLIPNKEVRNYIADHNFNMIESLMKTYAQGSKSVANWADYELIDKFNQGLISRDVLEEYLVNKESLTEYS